MKAIFVIATFLSLILIFALPCVAVDNDNTSPATDEYKNFFNSLPDSVADNLPDGVTGDNPTDDAAVLTSWSFILGAFGEILGARLGEIVPVFCQLLGLLLIAAAVGAVRSSLEPKTSKILGLCSDCAVAAAFIAIQISTLQAVSAYLTDLLTLANCIAPVVITLYAAGGNLATAGVSGGAMTIFLNFGENMLAKSVIPFTGVCLCLTAVQSAAPQVGLDGLLNLIKKTYTTVLTFIMSLLCAILAAQNAIAAGSDSVSLRAAKFVAGSAIPVVGGSVSESMKTLAASIGMLRKCFGITGIMLIALLTLPIIILLLLTRFTINVSAACADLLGCDREKKLLDGISGIYGCLAAVICACSLMFIFLLALLAGSITALNT